MVAHSTNEAWLSKVKEDVLEPDLPICDPHHHLWEFRKGGVQPRYLLDEILADTNGGHNIVSTVFIECGAMFRADGPENFRCVGETEFVNGIAAMSASGAYGKTRVAAGIIGTVDLRIGDAAADVLDAQIAAGGGRFRGIRRGAFWHASPDIRNHRTNPPEGLLLQRRLPRRLQAPGAAQAQLRGLVRPHPDPRRHQPRPRLPRHHHRARPLRRPRRHRPLRRQGGGGVRVLEGQDRRAGAVPERRRQARRAQHGGQRLRLAPRPSPPTSAELAEATRRYFDYTIERFGRSRCMFESNFPVDKLCCSYTVLWNSFKLLSKGYSADERAALFHGTAARVYRL